MSRRRKYILVPVVLLVTLALSVYCCGTVDIRTSEVKANSDEARGRQLLSKMHIAHGVAYWDSIQTYEVDFEDEFFGFIGKQGHPYKESKVGMTLQYIPNTYDGRMTFQGGKNQGLTWGIQSWQTYRQEKGGQPVFKKDKNITFWVPTYQYFFELPMRIQKADVVVYAGEKEIDGIACEGVFLSWKEAAPQRDIDQYLIWLNKENHLIELLEYTVRDQYNFLTGGAYYKDYMTVGGGLKIPQRMPVVSNLVKKGLLHEMRINNFKINPVTTATLRPDATIQPMGDDKPVD